MNNQNDNGKLTVSQIMAILKANQKIDLRQYVNIVWQRRWIILVTSSIITCAGIVYALLYVRPIYEVTASVQMQSSFLGNTVQAVTPGITNFFDRRKLAKKILSIEYLTQLADRLKLYQDDLMIKTARSFSASAPWLTYEEAIARSMIKYLRQKLEVTINPTGDQFQLSARDESPQMAYLIVKSMTEIFVDESKKSELRGIRGVKEFSDEQLEIYKNKVDESERKLKTFQERVASSKATNVGITSESIMRLQELKNATDMAIAHREKKLNELKISLKEKSVNTNWDEHPELADLKEKLDEKLAEFKKQLTSIGWQSSYDIKFNNEINNLRQQFQNKLMQLTQSKYQNFGDVDSRTVIEYRLVFFDIYYLLTRASIISEAQKGFLKLIKTEPANNIMLEKLQDELAENREIYKMFLEQSRGSQIEEALQHNDAEFKYQIVEPAQLPIYAVAGSKRNFVITAFILSLIVSGGIIFLLELFDQSIRSAEEAVDVLGVPVWGTVPRIKTPIHKIEFHWQQKLPIK